MIVTLHPRGNTDIEVREHADNQDHEGWHVGVIRELSAGDFDVYRRGQYLGCEPNSAEAVRLLLLAARGAAA